MSKKKKSLNSLEDLGGFVYSTKEDFAPQDDADMEAVDPSDQLLEVHLEKKGRGGKTAVIVRGFEGSEEELKDLAKELKSKCATGGSVKDGEIIIQGPVRDKVMVLLKDSGYQVKRVGG